MFGPWVSGPRCLPSDSGRCLRGPGSPVRDGSGQCLRGPGSPARSVYPEALVGVSAGLSRWPAVSPEWLWSMSPGPWVGGPRCLQSRGFRFGVVGVGLEMNSEFHSFGV